MAAFPSFPLYVNDFLSSGTVSTMNTEQIGAYLLLLFYAWRQEPVGTVPDDDETLASWTKMPSKKWLANKSRVLKAFTLQDGRWHNARMKKEHEKLLDFKKQKSEQGKNGASKRWKKDAQAMPEHGLANGEQMPEQCPGIVSPLAKSDAQPMANDSSSSSSSSLLSSSNSERDISRGGTWLAGLSEAFLRWWEIYPRREGQNDAWAAWQAAVIQIQSENGLTESAAEQFLQMATEDYAKSPAGRGTIGGRDFRPAPAKWLSAGRWKDDRDAWRKPNDDGQSRSKTADPLHTLRDYGKGKT